jgi:hypothetical protein
VALLAGCSAPADQSPSAVQKFTSTPAPSITQSPEPARIASPPPPAAAASDDRVVARINGEPITLAELLKPLLEAHGLRILNALSRLDLLKQEAKRDHETVTADDIRRERERVLRGMFKDADAREQDQLDDAEQKGDAAAAKKLRDLIDSDRQVLLDQYLENQHVSRVEFDLAMEINAYQRKKAERLLTGKITDEVVEKEFNIEYGETADVRYIQLANMQQVAQARQRLKNESFGDVAKEMSEDPRTAPLGGLEPGISRRSPGLPDTFKDMAFSLQPGQVSDTLNLYGHFFILKLDKKYPPKAVKFASVKDSLRKSMFDRLVQSLMGQITEGVNNDALKALKIEDPILKKAFDAELDRQESQALNRKKMEEQMKLDRRDRVLATQPSFKGAAEAAPAATAPATQP